MKRLLKKFCLKIFKKSSRHEPVNSDCVRLTNKELVFLHYALSLVKRSSIDHLNALSEFKTIKYIVEDYCWEMIQDSDKLLNVLDSEIRKRKLHKSYLEYKMEPHIHLKTEAGKKQNSNHQFNSSL